MLTSNGHDYSIQDAIDVHEYVTSIVDRVDVEILSLKYKPGGYSSSLFYSKYCVGSRFGDRLGCLWSQWSISDGVVFQAVLLTQAKEDIDASLERSCEG